MAYSRTLNHFTSMQELATIWASGTSYVVNQLVINSDKLYRCLIAHTSTASFATDLGAGNWVEVSASASGVKNYITNGNFENSSTSGWNLARSTLDATTKLPNQASGSWTAAAGTLSRTIVTSGQLSGVASLSLASSAATTAGDMLVTDALTLDLEAQASVQTFSFYYRVTSGASNGNFSGTSSNSIGVAIYVVDGALAGTWIQPAGVWSVNTASSVTAVTAKAAGTFQVPSDATQVRLAVYFPNASTGAITVYLDDFVLGPQVVQYGAPVTDWQDFPSVAAGTLITAVTTNPTYGTVAVNRAQWRRVGSDMEIKWDYRQTTAGTAGSGTYLFNLPAGYSIDTTKVAVTASADDSKSLGVFDYLDGSTVGTGYVTAHSATQLRMIMQYNNGSTGYGTGSLGSSLGGFTIVVVGYSIKARVPIAGWSSSVQMSNDTDTRVVAAVLQKNATQSVPTNTDTKVVYQNIVNDTHGAWDSTNNRYVAPVSGFYSFSAAIEYASAIGQVRLNVRKNGVQLRQLNAMDGATVYGTAGSSTVFLNAGDYLEIFVFQGSGGSVNLGASGSANYFSINRLSGPSAIAASESVNAKYTISTATQAPGALTQFNFDNRVFDSHGAVTTGAGAWRFTAPVSGTYTVLSQLYASSGNSDIWLYVNGTSNTIMAHVNTAATPLSGATMVRLNAGEYIDIRPQSAITVAGGSTPYKSHVSIAKVGN